ncbi:hypothetical protein IBX65_03150 [Candidatus Aerophobetes bacterium]|nr:hypothetical protein [Candidatus Aerophobetes bacterium]
MENPEIRGHLGQDEIEKLLDPANYLGLSLSSTDKVIASTKAARKKEEEDE